MINKVGKCLVLLTLSLTVILVGNAYAGTLATLQDPQGEVFIQKMGSSANAWEPVTKNTEVNSGDTLKTKNGSSKLVYGDQANITIQPNTTLTLKEESNSQDLHLKVGKLKIEANKAKITKPFQVVTLVAICAVRGTVVNFSFDGVNLFIVDLDTGEVYLYNNEAGMQLTLAGDKTITITFDPATGKLTVTNNSNEPIEFTLGGKKYTVPPGETDTATLKPGDSNEPPAVIETGGPDVNSETVPNEKTELAAEIPAPSSP